MCHVLASQPYSKRDLLLLIFYNFNYSGGWKTKITKVPAGSGSGEFPLLGLQMTTFLLCPHLVERSTSYFYAKQHIKAGFASYTCVLGLRLGSLNAQADNASIRATSPGFEELTLATLGFSYH